MVAGYVATWDANPSSAIAGLYLQRVQRGMLGGVRDALVDVPGRDGAYLFEERRGNKTISIDCTVVAAAPEVRHAALVTVADWLDRTGYRRLIVDDQPDRFWLAAVRSDPSPDEWRLKGTFSLEWTAQPYAYALVASEECQTGVLNNGGAPFNIDDTIDAYPVIEVTARGGNVDTFTLTASGDALTYLGVVNQNSSLTISSLNSTVLGGLNADLELTGAFISGSVFPGDVFGVFPVLVPGLNTWQITWNGSATSVDVCFKWRRRFR